MSRVDDYKIIHYYSFDDECFLAAIPDLPGCIADGQTVEEAVKNVKALAKEWIEITEEFGEEIPKPSFQTTPEWSGAGINDVASYILSKTGPITTKALQKLLFYCKAWSCGWFKNPIFPEQFEAWRWGPINRELYYRHSGLRIANSNLFDDKETHELNDSEKNFVDMILKVYGEFDPDMLGNMTHMEEPWIEARNGLPEDAPGENEIKEEDLVKYYK